MLTEGLGHSTSRVLPQRGCLLLQGFGAASPGSLGSSIARAPRCQQQGRGSPVLHHGGLGAATAPSPCGAQSQGGSLKEPTPAPCGASTSPNLRVLPGGAAWRGERLGPCRGLSSWCILQNAAHLAPLNFFYAEEGLQWDRALPPPSRCSPAQLLAFGCCCKGKGMSAVPGMDFFICAAVGDGSRRSCTH